MEDLIYCQKAIPKDKWRYGLRSSAATGCGWIATYNALRLMGYEADPEELIRTYTRLLPLIHGNAGTTILAPAYYFKKRGFRVEHTARNDRFDELAKKSDVCILFYRWHQKFKIGAHFVALHVTDQGFVGYNTLPQFHRPRSLRPKPAGIFEEKEVLWRGAVWYPERNVIWRFAKRNVRISPFFWRSSNRQEHICEATATTANG